MRKILIRLVLMLAPLTAAAQVQTTVAPVTLPNLGTDQKGANDLDATYCRPPQHRTDSLLMGPKVCMTNRQWDELRANGFEIAPDGSKVRIQKNVDILSR
jgi:hypothetical protein